MNIMKDLKKEIEELKEKIEQNPNNIENYIILGNIYVKNKNHIEGIKIFKKGLEKEENEEFYFRIGRSYDNIKDYSNAEKFYLEALNINKSEIVYKKRLINLYEKLIEIELNDEKLSKYIEEIINLGDDKKIKKLISKYKDSITSLKIKSEKEKDQLKQNIMQAVSHTLSNMLFVQKAITENIIGSDNLEDKVKRLKLFQRITSSVIDSIKLAFGKNIKNNIEFFNKSSENKISLFSIFYFALSINLDNLLQAAGHWETTYNNFFNINEYNEEKIMEKTDFIRANIDFKIFELSDEDIKRFIQLFNAKDTSIINSKFNLELYNFKDIYVRKDSYSFSVVFTIFQELIKNMFKYAIIDSDNLLKIKVEKNNDNFEIIFENKMQEEEINKLGTLSGVEMIKLFSNILGGFKKITYNNKFKIIIKLKKELFKENR